MLLEADLIAKRAALRWLVERYSYWTHHELAAALQMSRRLCEQVAPPAAAGRSRGCHGPALPLVRTPVLATSHIRSHIRK